MFVLTLTLPYSFCDACFAATDTGKRKRNAPVLTVPPVPKDDSSDEIRFDGVSETVARIISSRYAFGS